MPEPSYRKKLIEVDLPLDEINAESKREKSIRHGHPSTLHVWFAPRPLAACRAVLFASLVDDPSSCPEEFPTDEEQQAERARLHDLIKRLVIWKNSADETLIDEARYEIARSVARTHNSTVPTDIEAALTYLRDEGPTICDPFAGGGSIPLEAQRLGLKPIASDLNPVAVLINKALIELPPKFAHQPPVNPDADPLGMTIGRGKRAKKAAYSGAAGLAADIRYYGKWIRDKAYERIGHLYPKVKISDDSEATVIAWLWARTIQCPNPACNIRMPMMKTFKLSTKRNNSHWTKPIVSDTSSDISFAVQNHNRGMPAVGSTIDGSSATCIACGNVSDLSYIRSEVAEGRSDEQMIGIVAEGDRKRLFLSPDIAHMHAASLAEPEWKPSQTMPDSPTLVSGRGYGITHWHQLFTNRQLVALNTLMTLLTELREQVVADGATLDYAEAIHTYLSLAISKTAAASSRFNRWQNTGDFVAGVFGRQAIPMIWDFAETNIFSHSTQNWMAQINWVAKVLDQLPTDTTIGEVHQADAATTIHIADGPVIVTDPPYYANIDYADLSDFFYVWLRPLLRDIYPDLFSGILTPKQQEMIATPFRFPEPRERFEDLLGQSLRMIRDRCSPDFPSSIFYAYKQQEEERDGRTSTGWDTMLSALVSAGFQIIGTWPMRTERTGRPNAQNTNALASSVVLVCRPRADDAPRGTRREFFDALDKELPTALDHLTRGSHIAPVDLAQAAIGPGMEVYSRYSTVETISGEPVTVREALAAINQAIADYDERQQGELDAETRFCVDWLRQCDYDEGGFGDAEVLSQAKNVSIDTMAAQGLIESQSGRVRLRNMGEYDHQQLPLQMSAWEGCLRIGWHLSGAEDARTISGAAEVVHRMGSDAASIERLARILYNHHDRKRDSQNAVLYNSIVTEWPDIMRQADEPPQGQLFT